MLDWSASGKSRALLSTSWLPRARRRTAVKGGEAVPEGREDRRRSVNGAEDRSALEGWLAVGYWSVPRWLSSFPGVRCWVLVDSLGRVGWSQRVAHHCPSKWAWACRCSGCRAFFALGAHGGVRPQPGGFNHFVDVATAVGVMPLHEHLMCGDPRAAGVV